MCALSTGKKGKVSFFKGDEGGTSIGQHNVFDFEGVQQNVGMVQTWNQCHEMLLTSEDKPQSVLLMDTETGATKSELSLRRQQKNWKLAVDSITPMQKFEQYKSTQEYQLFGIGDDGHTVFGMNHDSRAGDNVEEFVIKADACRKYKSYVFSCHAQTKGGFLVLGRTDGAVALYDAIMQSENASCVIDGMPGPVTSIDVAADGSMIVWTTPEFVFFVCPSQENWTKGTKAAKPKVLKLDVSEADWSTHESHFTEGGAWRPVKFDASTAKDADGLIEREIITYSGQMQMRWNVRQARAAWAAFNDSDANPSFMAGVATQVAGEVSRHMTVVDDMDVIALEGDVVKSLRFTSD